MVRIELESSMGFNLSQMKSIIRIVLIILSISCSGLSSYGNDNLTNSNDKSINKKVKEIIHKLEDKKKLIKTAEIKGSVIYNFPLRKRFKLQQHFYIEKKSKIHVDIFAIWKIKIAEFNSSGESIVYKRKGKRDRVRDINNFNLSIFNKKRMNLSLEIEELNNILLGLNILDFVDSPYTYRIEGEELIILQNKNKCIINLKTNQIKEISIDNGRKMQIKYSKYELFKEFDIHLPLRIELKTETFSMQMNHENDIIVNDKFTKRISRTLINLLN